MKGISYFRDAQAARDGVSLSPEFVKRVLGDPKCTVRQAAYSALALEQDRVATLREDLYVVFEGLNADSDHPIIKIIINPLVNWIWIGVLVIVIGTGMALIPNASLVSVPVRSTVAVAQMEERGMHPAGAGK